jgi:hypothetical protein
MMKKIKFEITWEDVQHIAERDGSLIFERRGCELLKEIESGVRGWFEASKWDAISDSLTCVEQSFVAQGVKNWCKYGHFNCSTTIEGVCSDEQLSQLDPEPRDHNYAEGVVTMRDLA